MIIEVEQRHQEIHYEKDTVQQVHNEEDYQSAIILIGREHDVGWVCGSEQHQHVETAVCECREVLNPFDWPLEKPLAQEGKEEHVEGDEEDHLWAVIEHEHESTPSVPDLAHKDNQKDDSWYYCQPAVWILIRYDTANDYFDETDQSG